MVSRESNGVIVANPGTFPDGMATLSGYVHALGFKFGLYSDHGTATCQGKPGGYGYEYLDANTYAAWGVDYLKYDNCNVPPGRQSRGRLRADERRIDEKRAADRVQHLRQRLAQRGQGI